MMAASGTDVVDVIEPQISFLFVLAVALEAFLRQQGADVHLEEFDAFSVSGFERGWHEQGERQKGTGPEME
jgi:hypothetical protein